MNKIESFGVVGYGVVGQATAAALGQHIEFKGYYDIQGCDKPKGCRELDELVATNPDCIFVCVWAPTDMKTGEQYRGAVAGTINSLMHTCNYQGHIVVRSTITPSWALLQTVKRERICVSPEFLTEANAFEDAAKPRFNIVGGDNEAANALAELYRRCWPWAPVAQLSARDAMTTKYMINSFLAVKVAFFNECNMMLHDDWDAVVGAVTMDERIGKSHTQVPGPDGEFGFGGKCLPKDLRHFVRQSDWSGVLEAAYELNLSIRKHHDWEDIEGATTEN